VRCKFSNKCCDEWHEPQLGFEMGYRWGLILGTIVLVVIVWIIVKYFESKEQLNI